MNDEARMTNDEGMSKCFCSFQRCGLDMFIEHGIRLNHQRCRGGMSAPISSKQAKAFGAVLSSAGMSGDEFSKRVHRSIHL